ncbi:hypothetical protein SAMN05216464_103287 [Mucilaginibacter pineti]|uniref:Uncharacterized protein n=1 Tax=Mucilaginibacter pineti TaxID=1391627 RepID=A0A1G6ZBB2_9SPHI|nr:hypothetical protein [Mucilaginibacter pineti]SDD99880.1 hypothetical protein SAMN05216464_103287 [Mucilaginibacter pineti]
MNRTEQLSNDIKRLHNEGVNLVNAIQVEVYPEQLEAHFKENLKKDFEAFRQTLPVFKNAYQAWYSESQIVIKRFLPLRLNDFISLYEIPKTRKEVKKDNYTIEDFLRDTIVTAGFDKKVVAGPADAVPLVQQQLNILDSVSVRLQSTIVEITEILQAELLDKMLDTAGELAKNGLARSAGGICGAILQQHFETLRLKYNLKFSKKSPALKDYNEVLQKAEIYDFGIGRQIQYLIDLRDLCVKNNKKAPTMSEIDDLLSGTEKIIKTIF